MRDQTLLDECVLYFKSNKGFARVFEKMKQKYQSLGGVGGTVKLQNLSHQEKDALTGLLKKDCTNLRSVSIKVESFQKSLERTKFQGLALTDILNGYFGEELISNKYARSSHEEQRNKFFMKIITRYLSTPAGRWLEHAWIHRGDAYRTLVQRYDAGRDRLRQDISAVCQAINNLPCFSNEKVRLPVFASNITKDPHAFDEKTGCGQLLIYALMYHFNVSRPKNAEERAELYYRAGILSDEVSNYVLCSGLRAYSEHKLHQGWEGFYFSGEPMQVTLINLSRLDRVVSPSGKVFVIENPGVFAAIKDRTLNDKVPLVCTYGQVKIASLMLLDMLAKEEAVIYYSGDFDPEGLLIADRLKSRYGEKLKLWRYTPEDYEEAISGQSISVTRLKKMESLKDETLITLGQYIRCKGYAGYQELLVDKLVEDVKLV